MVDLHELREVADLAGAEVQRSHVRLHPPHQKLDEGGLTGPVAADQAEAVAQLDLDVHILQDLLGSEGLAHALRLQEHAKAIVPRPLCLSLELDDHVVPGYHQLARIALLDLLAVP